MQRAFLPALMLANALAGCSSNNGTSASAVLGTAPTPPPASAAATGAPGAPTQTGAIAPMAPASTPTDRAFQVGTVSARATKCGYNFDPARLKAAYMANEMGRGTSPADMGTVEKIYSVSYNGVMKAAAEDPNYCSAKKTKTIKADLNRLLAGDFEPPRKAVVAQKQEEGWFDWLDGSSNESGPSWGSDDWWAKQNEKIGQ